MAGAERGFTIIEALIAGAIVTLMALTGLTAAKAVAAVTLGAYTAGRDAAAIDIQAERLRDDAASAFAVFVPATDMNGAPNGAGGDAHEVDYYARGDGGQELLWRYFYDAARGTLQRFDYDPSGTRGVRDAASGLIDSQAAYPVLKGLSAFGARAIPADELGDAGLNVYSGVTALFGHPAVPQAVSYNRPGLDVAAAVGGNALIAVTLSNASAGQVVHLAAGSMPTGFTVTGLPRWHAIVYRIDQTHRSWAGIAGKSHVFIRARVDVSYDDWSSRASWCDFNLLGDPYGLDGHDPHADYKPKEPFEQAEALLARCRLSNPTPPPRGFPGNAPEPGPELAPLPTPTPPACWTAPGPQGRCWPLDAPADWAPPSPLPVDSPPPEWCAGHARSSACRPPASVPRSVAPGFPAAAEHRSVAR